MSFKWFLWFCCESWLKTTKGLNGVIWPTSNRSRSFLISRVTLALATPAARVRGAQLVYPAIPMLLTHSVDHHQSSQHDCVPQGPRSTAREQASESQARLILAGLSLVGVCFSKGCSMRLSRVTCCFAQRAKARWSGTAWWVNNRKIVFIFENSCMEFIHKKK